MWGFCESPRGPLHVKVRGSVTREPPGVRVHRTTARALAGVGKLRGVPVTSPTATLVDLAATLPRREVESALQRAVVGGCVDAGKLREFLERSGGRGCRGPAVLRDLLPPRARRNHVRTPLEEFVADMLAAPGLPPFCCEYPVYYEGRVFYLDFAYPEALVAVEADGRRWHSDATAFEQDRARHNALTSLGWKVLRVTDRQVRTGADEVRRQVLDLVGATPGNRR